MKIVAITCSRYRAFKDPVFLELRPITLIIGKNGSGKSVLTRLPLIMADAIKSDAEGVLSLTAGDIEHAASFEDLVNKRSALPFTLGVAIQQDENLYKTKTTIRHIPETKSLIVEAFEILKNEEIFMTIKITNEEQLLSEIPSYDIVYQNKPAITANIQFRGIIPTLESMPQNYSDVLTTILLPLKAAFPSPSYLGPFRDEPERYMRVPNQKIRKLGPRGEHTLSVLADDKLRNKGALSLEVENWFTSSLGQSVSVDVTGEQPRVSVINDGLTLGISDTGVGFSQCLPIVVQHLGRR